MKISDAQYIKSAVYPSDFPDGIGPEIAFAGRSNVGKSSLINSLVNRKRLAQTSSQPGRTQTLNFYLVNYQLYLVDLPGYGYTRAPESVSLKWRQAIDRYLSGREQLTGCIHLIDIRHDPTSMDIRVSNWLKTQRILLCTLAVKADKLSRSACLKAISRIRATLDLGDSDPIMAYSSLTNDGRDALWQLIEEKIGYEKGDRA